MEGDQAIRSEGAGVPRPGRDGAGGGCDVTWLGLSRIHSQEEGKHLFTSQSPTLSSMAPWGEVDHPTLCCTYMSAG